MSHYDATNAFIQVAKFVQSKNNC